MNGHTVVELESDMVRDGMKIDQWGEPEVDYYWDGPHLPVGYDFVAMDGPNECGAKAECGNQQVVFRRGDEIRHAAVNLGWGEGSEDDDYGRPTFVWVTPFLIDEKWVVCEDCCINIEAGDLVEVDGALRYVGEVN